MHLGSEGDHFAVNSNTQLTATVPTGAKTGKIAVTTLAQPLPRNSG
jgi:hypothetical protein